MEEVFCGLILTSEEESPLKSGLKDSLSRRSWGDRSLVLEKEGRRGANNVFNSRTNVAHLCVVISRITVWLDSLTLNELSSNNSLCWTEVLNLSSFLGGLFCDPCRDVMSWNISLRVAWNLSVEICHFERVHFSSGTLTNSKLPQRRCL